MVNPAVACSEYPAHPRGGYRTNRSEFTDERVSVCIYLCLWPCLCMRLSVVYARSRLRVVLMCARMCHVMCLTLCCAVAMAYVVRAAQRWENAQARRWLKRFSKRSCKTPFPGVSFARFQVGVHRISVRQNRNSNRNACWKDAGVSSVRYPLDFNRISMGFAQVFLSIALECL